ncbi:MAG: ABC transporter permease [Actinomycetes bacterium]
MASGSRRKQRDLDVGWLMTPMLVLLLILFVVPVGLLLLRSFTGNPGGLTAYREFLGTPEFVGILWRTIYVALIVTLISLAVGYPYAYLAARSSTRVQRILIGLVSVSLFLSLVVRCYAWLAILGPGGVLNLVAHSVGLNVRINGVHNMFGVLVGDLQYTLPFVILPIYDVMRRVDPRLMSAAATLGGGPVRRFIRVYLPSTMPGVAAGCLVAFVATLGYYITPSILGAPQNMMIGQLIAGLMLTSLQWDLGTAVASILLVTAVAFFVGFRRIMARVA